MRNEGLAPFTDASPARLGCSSQVGETVDFRALRSTCANRAATQPPNVHPGTASSRTRLRALNHPRAAFAETRGVLQRSRRPQRLERCRGRSSIRPPTPIPVRLPSGPDALGGAFRYGNANAAWSPSHRDCDRPPGESSGPSRLPRARRIVRARQSPRSRSHHARTKPTPAGLQA